jgi:hypothetical protein
LIGRRSGFTFVPTAAGTGAGSAGAHRLITGLKTAERLGTGSLHSETA